MFKRTTAILLHLTAALCLLWPSHADAANAYKAMAAHRFVLGTTLGPQIPMTEYDELVNNLKTEWKTFFHIELNTAYLVSPLGGIHVKFDVGFGFITEARLCDTFGNCASGDFKPSIKVFEFIPGVEGNLSFFRFPLYFTPELGLGLLLAHHQDWKAEDDPQVGLVIRPGLGVTYTLIKRIDFRFTPVALSIMVPFTDSWRDSVGTQVSWNIWFTFRVRL